MSAKVADNNMESPAAIAAIDDLLASVGIEHGSRKTLKSAADKRRQPPVSRGPAPLVAQKGKIAPLQIAEWQTKYPWLMHGFSTRLGGLSTVYQPGSKRRDLNLGFTTSDSMANVQQNRQRFINAIAGDRGTGETPSLVTLKQIHSSLIRELRTDAQPNLKGDGLLTRQPGVLLGILTADCIPVLVADTRRRIVAAFHAGWRGTLARIVENGIGRMRAEFGSRPQDMTAAIGPGIGQCCYAVGEDLRFEFESQFAYGPSLFREVYDSDPIREKYPLLFLTARAPGHSNIGPSLHLDLHEANRRQLLDAGVLQNAIHSVDACTSCHPDQFFSHRAQQGFTGRMMSVIGVKA
jgi:YfiH family protein